ncbi:MAG: acyloxyacyl hydrolase [Opitutales bacterium]|nr:acyloxyacyl hydrolase [Opitutales bacterium]MCH8541788.1 acyloxyacyl hydrolase [Opitutales bacterium]
MTSRLTLLTHFGFMALYLGGILSTQAEERFTLPETWDDLTEANRWTFSSGAAVITSSTIDELFLGSFHRTRGDAGGMLYLLGASYTLAEPEITIREQSFFPQLEVVAITGLANENNRSPFHEWHLGTTLRWKDFPWNEFVYTNFETGVGLSYLEKIYLAEKERHPGRSRSHLRFYWPIEISLAHPNHRQHQMRFFIHHNSGGRLLQKGGSNHVGIGYRYVFGER